MLTQIGWMMVTYTIFKYLDIGPEDVDLTAQPFYYADPQWNVLLCMMGGIPLVIMPRFSVSQFWPTVIEQNVTFFYMLGVMPNLLIKRDPDELEKNHKVRIVICSGIVPQLHKILEKRFNCPWREAYGLTEAGMDIFVPIDDTESVGSGAVGKSMNPNTQARIVDRRGLEVPVGQSGELILKGESMMLGYWKKPEATAEMFRDGWCHTGDLAYKDEKGYLHLVGRIKEMVRRGAENISTAEVEGVLAENDKIVLSAIVPIPDPLRGEEVKAYVVLKQGENKDTVPPQDIIEFAKSKLARFKVPRYIEYADDLPRTPSERVEKHKLMKAKEDLRLGSYDAEKNSWITKSILEKLENGKDI
jgi:crotonobetaine/carnitine-CoA ligase